MAQQHNTVDIDPRSLLNTFIHHRSVQLVSVLGVGAYGTVYMGVHVKTGRRYAVKLITKPNIAERETRIHRRVSGHPGILGLEKVVRQGDWTFIILEYATEGDLFNAITQQKSVTGNDDAIRHIFLQIINAVQHCHKKGIAHRDLKPENILVFPNFQVKLGDFGLATTQPMSSEFGCGSNFYFSPECQGHAVKSHEYTKGDDHAKGYNTQKSDIWSLGVILINLVTGRNPWRQASMKDKTFSIFIKKPHHFFQTTLPGISEELEHLLVKVFCVDPAKRISLSELRVRIACMRSFTRSLPTSSSASSTAVSHPRPAAPKTTITQNPINYSASLVCAVNDYAAGFDDSQEDETHTRPKPVFPPPLPSAKLPSLPPPPLPTVPISLFAVPSGVPPALPSCSTSSSSLSSYTSSIELLVSPQRSVIKIGASEFNTTPSLLSYPRYTPCTQRIPQRVQ